MEDSNDLRSLVLARKGQWTRIARLTGLNRKTLERIASGETPDFRSSTERKIREALASIPSREIETA